MATATATRIRLRKAPRQTITDDDDDDNNDKCKEQVESAVDLVDRTYTTDDDIDSLRARASFVSDTTIPSTTYLPSYS